MRIYILHRSDLGGGSRIMSIWSSLPSAQQIQAAAGEDVDIDMAREVIDKGACHPHAFAALELEHRQISKGEF